MEKNSDGSVISAYDYPVNAIGQRERVDRSGSAFATPDPVQWSYDAFGNEIDSKTTGSKANRFAYRFSTKPLDSETGFYYYGYRYYNPVTGTWPSRDPLPCSLRVKEIDCYAFLVNCIIDFYDKLGLESCSKGAVKYTKAVAIPISSSESLEGSEPVSSSLLGACIEGIARFFRISPSMPPPCTRSTDYTWGWRAELKYDCCICDQKTKKTKWVNGGSFEHSEDIAPSEKHAQ